MDEIKKAKIRIWKKDNEGSKDYYKLVGLEEKYSDYDENIAISWIGFLFMSMFTFLIAMPIMLVVAVISTIINVSLMNGVEKQIEVLLK